MPPTIHTSRLFSNIQEDINALFKVIPAFIMTIGPDGRIQAANDAACQFMQTPSELMVGRIFDQLWPEEHSIIHEHLNLALNLRVSTSFEVTRDNYVTSLYLYPIENGQTISSVIAFGLDATDRLAVKEQIRDLTLQIEEKVRERTRELAEINEQLREEKRRSDILAYFSQMLLKSNANHKPLLRAITEDISNLIGESASIILFSPDMLWLEVAAFSHPDPAMDTFKEQYYEQRIPATDSLFLRQALQKANYKLRNISAAQMREMITEEFYPLVRPEGYKTLLAIPLMTGIQTLGLLVVARENNENDYREDEITFLNSLTSAIALSIQNTRLMEELRQSQARVRGVSQQLVQKQETQFRHMAREMHDQVGQDMTAININLNLIRNTMQNSFPAGVGERMDDTIKLVETAVDQMRTIMAEFRPPVLDAYGLAAALYWYAEQFSRRTNIEVQVSDRGLLDTRMNADVEIGLFRIAQEALNNTAKHARASQIQISLGHIGGKILMEIKDNGVGFDLKKRRSGSLGHWGLAIMRERTEAMGGKFHINSKPGQGVVILVEVPEKQMG